MYILAGETAEFRAHFQDADGVSKSGLTVTYDLIGPARTILTSGSAAEILTTGEYYVTHKTTTPGLYSVIFKTADTTVAARDLATLIQAFAPGVWKR